MLNLLTILELIVVLFSNEVSLKCLCLFPCHYNSEFLQIFLILTNRKIKNVHWNSKKDYPYARFKIFWNVNDITHYTDILALAHGKEVHFILTMSIQIIQIIINKKRLINWFKVLNLDCIRVNHNYFRFNSFSFKSL